MRGGGQSYSSLCSPPKAGDKGCSPGIAVMPHSLLPPLGQGIIVGELRLGVSVEGKIHLCARYHR